MLDSMSDELQFRGSIDKGSAPRAGNPRTSAKIILICPDDTHRRSLLRSLEAQNATIASVLTTYPDYNQIVSLADVDFDAVIVDLDADSDTALDIVESICSRKSSGTVMVYSERNDSELLMASMRAGAREFLSGAVAPNVLTDALLRAAARRIEKGAKKTQAKILMFWGAKGGSGVTTLATNFAIALHRETGGPVALLDFNPHLGDVSVLLGLTPRFTITDALMNPNRLDEEFISTLVTEHRSGVSVFAAPDSYAASVPTDGGTFEKLVELVGGQFPYVVIDAGLGLGTSAEALFQLAGVVYLVTQVDISSLRNSQRFISYFQNLGGLQVELVLNRFEPRKVEFDEERLSKTVGMVPKWKVPNDYVAVRRASNIGTPLIEDKSPIGNVLHQMARSACGKQPEQGRKKGFGLFG
jgi:pilus assembly protein CpaE